MTTRLPPLNALRAFSVAARHLSFKAAASELHVTPSAISHQVKTLEDYLGVALFHRGNQGLLLTATGRVCLPQLEKGFRYIEEAVSQLLTPPDGEVLRLGVPPSLATKWLMPRLPRFLAVAPHIKIQIFASTNAIDTSQSPSLPMSGMDDLGDSPTDIAIRFGKAEHAGYYRHKLFSVAVTPLCSPALLEGQAPLRHPADLNRHVFLHDDSTQHVDSQSFWDLWLTSADLPEIERSQGLRFSHSGLALDAAARGLGVVATASKLAECDIAERRLIKPFELSVPLQSAYYLTYPQESIDTEKIRTFRDWILAECDPASALL